MIPRSSRDIALVLLNGEIPAFPIITVEYYDKWYELYLLFPTGKAHAISFMELEVACESGESAFADHVPNPVVVQRYAEQANLEVDPLAMELMIGRWEIEVKNNYGGRS